ncbi:hypothetical protein JNB62_13195 [Microbacterium jejuense]|uniref:Uncharacterized protein n=1 Tax=Microbacterium jejuense TaxID=1263637 RepID=A0ABS7HQW8_9MICO|nr:hypothetical protein [Microbacterium jejuense]MBW9094646.1 hypothetical protein [Microbacterium jejuense]
MIALTIAAACMWRGLTSEETDAVAAEVQTQLAAIGLETLTAGVARDVLEAAISTVLAVTRPG